MVALRQCPAELEHRVAKLPLLRWREDRHRGQPEQQALQQQLPASIHHEQRAQAIDVRGAPLD